MSESDAVFAGNIPKIYDSHMVPMLFAPFAEDLARRVVEGSPRDVLEIAAGTGVVTRVLAPLLPELCDYLVTDLNPGMLEQARLRQGEDSRLSWQVADAGALGLPEQSRDVALCQFGAMFFPDKLACFSSIRSVLRPGGRWVFNVWDRIEENEVAHLVTRLMAELFPEDPPRFLVRTPHGYNEKDWLRADLSAAGFGGIEVETVTLASPIPDAGFPAMAYCYGSPLGNEIRARDADRLAEAMEVIEKEVAARWGSGPSRSRMQAHVITARA